MENLEKISECILIDEVAEARQALENLLNLEKEIQSEIAVGILPFLSSLAEGIIKFLPSEDIKKLPRVNNIELKEIIGNVRVGYKQNSDKSLGKATTNSLEREDSVYSELVKDYNILQKERIRIEGQKDLGVFYFKDIPYANTNQYQLHLTNMFNQKEIKEISYFSKEAVCVYMKYSEELAWLISSFNRKDIIKYTDIEMKYEYFEMCDYFILDEKRRDFLTGSLDIGTQLLLFNILCQNNFILFVLPLVFKSDRYFFTRSLLQTYLVSHTVLLKIYNKYSNILTVLQKDRLQVIIDDKINKLNIDNKFRNNIFHYKVSGVPDSIFTSRDRFFEELVEFHSGKNFNDYQMEVINEVVKVNKLIKELITDGLSERKN